MNFYPLPIRVQRKQCIITSVTPKMSSCQRKCVVPDELWLCKGLWHMWSLSGWVWGRSVCPWIPVWDSTMEGTGANCMRSFRWNQTDEPKLRAVPAEARRMLQPAVRAGWSGYNRGQIWPSFSSVVWPQNCSASLLCNILDVPEQVKFLVFLDNETIFLLFCTINYCKIQIEISCWYVGFLSGFVWFGCYAWFLTKHSFQCTFMSAMALFETAVLLKVPRRVVTLNSRHPSFD